MGGIKSFSITQIVSDKIIVLDSDINNNTATMQPATPLSIDLQETGLYRIEFYPLYDVDLTTTGVGFNFQGGTAVLNNYTFRAIYPTGPTTNFQQNNNNKAFDWSGVQSGALVNNRATVIAEFEVTTTGTLVPHFKSESAPPGQFINLKAGSYIIVKKIA